MPPALRSYEPHDFATLYKLDQACFPAGISYSKTTLRYFLTLPSADCAVAEDGGRIVGFILSEENPPLAHIITLDVVAEARRHQVGSALLQLAEKQLRLWNCTLVRLETAVDNISALSFYKRHWYHVIQTIPRYYSNGVDALLLEKDLLSPPPSS